MAELPGLRPAAAGRPGRAGPAGALGGRQRARGPRPPSWRAASCCCRPGCGCRPTTRDALAGVRRPAGRRRTSPRSGSGSGSPTTRSPPALVEAAADGAGCRCSRCPRPTAFIAVSKAVSALLGAEEYDAITRAFETQRDLTRAALGVRGASGGGRGAAGPARRRLGARAGRGRARCCTQHPGSGARDATSARATTCTTRWRRCAAAGCWPPRPSVDARGQVSLHPLGASGRVRGFLAVGTAGAAGPRRPVGGRGRGVAALASPPSRTGTSSERGWPGSAAPRCALLVAGAEPRDLPLDQLGWAWLPDGAVRCSSRAPAPRCSARRGPAGLDAAGADRSRRRRAGRRAGGRGARRGRRRGPRRPPRSVRRAVRRQRRRRASTGSAAAAPEAAAGAGARAGRRGRLVRRGSRPTGCSRRSTRRSPAGWRRDHAGPAGGAQGRPGRLARTRGWPTTASGTPRPPTSACTGTPCATACAGSRSCSAARWTTRTCGPSCGSRCGSARRTPRCTDRGALTSLRCRRDNPSRARRRLPSDHDRPAPVLPRRPPRDRRRHASTSTTRTTGRWWRPSRCRPPRRSRRRSRPRTPSPRPRPG